ncbi:MAG: TonB-dependent receptor [Gammaproteobacteria bacterium]|nr:TonB-dependent receptor [Gammaproteobacteria bacterium]
MLKKFVSSTLATALMLPAATFVGSQAMAAEEGRRQIEEVIVTAERRESTVSDTSMSITAFTGEFIEDFGIRNQEDLQNLIPAAVIEPYDMAVRGVGRNFRSLGGDPGIATYLNGVYSEDFGIASTEGGLFDIERIEVLRGPQGTLYGRNAIGGAINFINKLPADEFEGEARVVVGDYDLLETYGVVSIPVIKDVLSARVTGVKRAREGYYHDLSGNPDPGNYGDENYALSLRFTPTENLEFNVRGNERSYARRMAGADAAGVTNLTEAGGRTRDTSTYVFGFRAVNPNNVCPNAFTRTAPVAVAGIIGGVGCAVAGRQIFNFNHPVTGAPVAAQRVVPGHDKTTIGTTNSPNLAFGAIQERQVLTGLKDLDSSDLKTDTNGQQDEFFDHQAVSFDANWTISDQFSLKYIFGYTDYFYDRTSDVDLTSNKTYDNTFYVSQETEYISHELQAFIDPTEDFSVTMGVFAYDAKISQRGDYYDYNCTGNVNCASRYANDGPYNTIGGILNSFAPGAGNGIIGFGTLPKVGLFSARLAKDGVDAGGALPGNCLSGPAIAAQDQLDIYCFGSWKGDKGDRIQHGPSTIGTNLEYQTRSERYAYAAYGQAVYDFNEHFALTVGLRWARDSLSGAEDVFYYNEESIIPLGFGPGGNGCATGTCTSDLGLFNQLIGALGPNGEILNPNAVMVAGLPASNSITRDLKKITNEMTWRVNLDWTPNDDDLIYLSATKGIRSGGMNLVFFSSNGTFDPEELIAYELGYKGTKFDGAMQINAAIYNYDYENVHTFVLGRSFAGGYATNVVPVPKGNMKGFEGDILWLATEAFTIGANLSITKSKYESDIFSINPIDENAPESIFDAFSTPKSLKGNQMIRVPEIKYGAFAQYTHQLGDNGKMEYLVNYSWIDRVYFTVFEDKNHSAPSYDRVDFRASWRSASEQWMVAAFVNNVFDKIGVRQIDQYQANETTNYRRTGALTDPRLWGLEVRYKFGAFQ